MPVKITDLNVNNIIELYNAGTSINELAKIFNVARTVIYNRLIKSGIVIRGRTQANQLMMSKRTPEENRKNTVNAHNAIKGKTYTHEELCHRATSPLKSLEVVFIVSVNTKGSLMKEVKRFSIVGIQLSFVGFLTNLSQST